MRSKWKFVIFYSFVAPLLFTMFITPQKAQAASCSGLTPMTDPLALRMEKGETVIWDNVKSELKTAKLKYEQLLNQRGWKIQYTSAYRPYQYQKHLYEIVHGTASSCKSSEKSKHGLGKEVAAPSTTAPHTSGIAFDAIVKDQTGKALNGMTWVSSSLVSVAKEAGLSFPLPTTDGVHHQVIKSGTTPPATKIATGTVNIKDQALNVRSGPGTNYSVIATVKKGQKVDIYKREGTWLYIQSGSVKGYVSKDYIIEDKPITPTPPPVTQKIGTGIVNTTSTDLNVRSGPSTNYKVVGVVKKGTTVDVLKAEGDWYYIQYGSLRGYVSKAYIKYTSITPAAPTEQPFVRKGKITEPLGFNVRSGANANATRVGGVYKDNIVDIVAKNGDWYKIKFGNGYGYIMAVKSGLVLIDSSVTSPATPSTKLADSATFSKILAFTLKWEGGYSNHPNDPGGSTNKGITQSVYTSYLASKKQANKNVKYITDAQVRDIYFTRYWVPLKLNRMNEKLAMIMFDTAVNVGPYGNSTKAGGAIKFLQQAMGVGADGSWGPKTEAAFVKQPVSNHDNLAKKVWQLRVNFRYERVKQDPGSKTFLQGWLNRDNDLKNFVGI